ncbi:MAG: hypothetical protein C0407_12785 [Desulfobacca sp.]|nr:hypothetical protein [Desulfobacca sp.]
MVCGLVLMATGCTAKQVYGSAQGMRQHECNKIVNQEERTQCVEIANTSYEKYKRERDEALKTP